jgi:arginase family enzyme
LKTHALFFPFDLFGNPGTRAGAELLADAFEEMLADCKREKIPARGRSYASRVRFHELLFDRIEDYQEWRPRARHAIAEVLDRGNFLLWCAGNHLGALPLYDELAHHHKDTLVLHFDAHLDIYHLSDCTRELSHGNFLRHCEGPLPNIVHIGHRDLFLRKEDARPYFKSIVSAADIALDADAALRVIREAARDARRIVVDLDCDVFDPAYFPAVQQPQPLGIAPAFVLRCLDAVWSTGLAALAVSEFDPAHDRRDQSLGTLLWLIEYVLLRLYEK